jgi:hypothetical protein
LLSDNEKSVYEQGSLTSVPLLDNNRENSTYKTFNGSKNVWTNSQRNAFVRVKCGITAHKGEILRFLTLTSAPEMLRPINSVFDCMKTMIRRYTPYRLYKENYINKNGLRHFYGNKNPDEGLKFDYIKIKTTEGNGVLHIPYFGDYLPFNFLCDIFSFYSGFAWDLDIRRVGGSPNSNKDRKKLSYYVMNQYVTNQKDKNGFSVYNGYNAGWHWVFRGFTNWYNQFKDNYRCLDYEDRNKVLNAFLIRKGWIPPPEQQFLDGWFSDNSLISTRNCWNGSGWENRNQVIYNKSEVV